SSNSKQTRQKSNKEYLQDFLAAKRVEGCSDRTEKYYRMTLDTFMNEIQKNIQQVTTEDLRKYLTDYQEQRNSSKQTTDNIRQIHKVKTPNNIKEKYSDEELEKLRDNCTEIRDLALIDLLASTGMRVGELVRLNRDDIDFEERECVVLGKGNKERIVYFDARS